MKTCLEDVWTKTMSKDEVRDLRTPGWSWFNDKLITEDGDKLGTIGIAIYVVLCTFADNKTQECYPSHKTIAKMLDVSRPTVKKYLEKLRSTGWIEWEERHSENGGRSSNKYTLLPPPVKQAYSGVVKETYPGSVKEVDKNHTHENQNKNTKENPEKELDRFFGERDEGIEIEPRKKHLDPVGEIKESLRKSYERDRETPEMAVTRRYCKQIGMDLDTMPENKRESLLRRFKTIIDNWGGATKEQAVLAWRKWREKYEWKEPNAFYPAFENEYGQILQAVKSGSIVDDSIMRGSV